MSLATLLDTASAQRFPDMTMVTVRDILKEIQSLTDPTLLSKEVGALTPHQRDVLLKVVYVGLAKDSKNSSAYFKWHAAIYAVAGAGAIVRVISDKPPKVEEA